MAWHPPRKPERLAVLHREAPPNDPRPIACAIGRALRNLTRYRKTQARAREANRLHKALEDTGIKLDCVATDILGNGFLERGDLLRAKIPALKENARDRAEQFNGAPLR